MTWWSLRTRNCRGAPQRGPRAPSRYSTLPPLPMWGELSLDNAPSPLVISLKPPHRHHRAFSKAFYNEQNYIWPALQKTSPREMRLFSCLLFCSSDLIVSQQFRPSSLSPHSKVWPHFRRPDTADIAIGTYRLKRFNCLLYVLYNIYVCIYNL